ncbi:EAL domain-containing protein [Marinobacter sp. chi1]|uniref:EAL domain-containing protein n=1 Tax=Marinobacter suaedae TaxID=3057675 RepID=A0ABT8VZC1_9GAMM|nr:EAL domain-containing protein [Marinobacter sp. chi1]MDO3721347.1 EAL domain-containing protein [Marinobacter sp. chi1]
MKRFFKSPLIRISFSLTLLTVSILLVADVLGLIPDTRHAQIESRKLVAESLAIQVSNEISNGRVKTIDQILQSVVDRNDIVSSIAVRKNNSELLAEFGDHEQHWSLKTGDKSTTTQVLVPLFKGQLRWGNVEIVFADLHGAGGLLSLKNSYLGIVLFVSLGGFLVYLLFLKRALRELNPDAVIPERVSRALDTLSEGLLILDDRGFIVFANSTFSEKIRLNPNELLGKAVADFQWEGHGPESEEFERPWVTVLAGEVLPGSVTMKLKNGLDEVFIFTVNASPISATEGKVRGVLITFDDITEVEAKNEALNRALKELENSQSEISRQNQELQWLASRDPLTGALNRRSLTHHMGLLFDEARREGSEFSCIMVDIDHFKLVNDRYGHPVGDEVIKLLTHILTECSRSGDLIGRFGGEEFVVVLPETGIKAAVQLAEQMRSAVEAWDTSEIHSELHITSSFGVAALSNGASNATDLLAQADKALYAAKGNGRNRVICWSWAKAVGSANSATLPPHEDLLIDSGTALELTAKAGAGEGGTSPSAHSSIALLQDRIDQGINRAQRDGSQIAVLLMHVDTLERVKDSLGFAATDKLANQVLIRLKQTLRSTDTVSLYSQGELFFTVSRLGGNEIALVLTDLQRPEIVTSVLKRIFLEFEQPITVESNEIYLNMDVGISLFPQDGDGAESLLRNASGAMRLSRKAHGSNNFRFYAEEINQLATKQIQLEADLHRALKQDELTVYYQPKIDLITGKIRSMEALVRWHHPLKGLIPPDEFIPAAEQAGLIKMLDRWVIRAVCRQIRFWQKAGFGTMPVAVNISPSELRSPDLAEQILAILEEFVLPVRALELEITETAFMHSMDDVEVVLKKLSSAGMKISLDDFGIGYSSLNYLKRFPISMVKIDRSFIADILHDANDAAIVSAIIAMGHSLDIRVVAEGVETEEQLRFLQDLHCDEVQGYLLSRPVPKEAMDALMAQSSSIRRLVVDNDARHRNLADGHTAASGMIGVLNNHSEKSVS